MEKFYHRDLDGDGLIDLFDIDDQDSRAQTIADIEKRDTNKLSLNDRLDIYLQNEKERELPINDRGLEL